VRFVGSQFTMASKSSSRSAMLGVDLRCGNIHPVAIEMRSIAEQNTLCLIHILVVGSQTLPAMPITSRLVYVLAHPNSLQCENDAMPPKDSNSSQK
jgi:hypothetical protein